MSSGFRVSSLLMAVMLLFAVGCSRNKPAATAPAGSAALQPAVDAAAPAPAAHRSSTFVSK